VTKDDEIQGCKKRILELERENDELRKENASLRNKDNSRRGVPEEELIAKLTDGKRTRYKDGHDVTTKSGHLLEVKHSKVDRPGPSRTLRWTWAGVLGLNGTKKYDFLVLMGKKDPGHPEYNAQYPDYAVPKGLEALLDYVTFLVPRGSCGQH
jgi:hypothetical protein